MKRIIEISKKSYLSIENKQLVINQNNVEVGKVPMEDVGKIILDNSSITITQAVLVLSQKNNIALVVCDEKHLPTSILLPITEGNKLHSKVLKGQVEIRLSTKKRLWQDIVRQKILNQAGTLRLFDLDYRHLSAMVLRVKSGDTNNMEATAARYYWKTLFGDEFRRNPESSGINALLNYGYSIIRASIARALVGTGLHPALGIHHQSQYNGLALADDLMEPFRPWIDQKVKEIAGQGIEPEINRETKQNLLAILESDVQYREESCSFLNCLGFLASDLKQAILTDTKALTWPSRA